MYKSIVFDLDGTLIESPLCLDSIRTALDIPVGQLILEAIEKMPLDVQARKRAILEQMEISAAHQSVLIIGVSEFLAQTKSGNIKIGIFTRNCRSVTNIVMKRFLLPVDAIITREDAPPKPDPQGLVILMKKWNLKPEELLYVGDFHLDIQCGKQAGAKTALFTNGQMPSNDFGADYIFDSYADFATQHIFKQS